MAQRTVARIMSRTDEAIISEREDAETERIDELMQALTELERRTDKALRFIARYQRSHNCPASEALQIVRDIFQMG